MAQDLQLDLCSDDFAAKKHKEIRGDSDDVLATIQFFKRTIRQLVSGTYRHFDARCGFLDAKARRSQSARATVAAEAVPKLQSDVKDKFTAVVAGMRERLHGFWVHQHSDIWPASVPDPSESEADDSGSDGVQEPVSVTRRPSEGEGGAARARGRKRRVICEEGEELVGRVVAVPSWCCGQRWSANAFGGKAAAKRARLHGVLEPSDNGVGMNCRFWNDEGYVLNLNDRQVREYLVPVGEEHKVRDTPFREGFEG